MGSGNSKGRGAVSLGIGLLLGIFISAFVSMIASSAGTALSNGWLGLIGLAVMVGGLLPIHRLVWNRAPRPQAVETRGAETLAADPGADSDGWGESGPRGGRPHLS